eukprot:GFUD01002452.1.p1 GENE.GFUD01002452.1~~GFUD01002452.1.p1  ORF type:complete len:335 (-),score=80.96 GFUD01002452.1:127-1131(-)
MIKRNNSIVNYIGLFKKKMNLLDLPDLVLIKLIKLLRYHVLDLYNFSMTCKSVSDLISQNFDILYYENLTLSSASHPIKIDRTKPVLNLRLEIVKEPDSNFESAKDEFNKAALVFNDELEQRSQPPTEMVPKKGSKTEALLDVISTLNLSMIRALDIALIGSEDCLVYPYHQFLGLNHAAFKGIKRCNIKRLTISVKFMCSICTDFIMDVLRMFPLLEELTFNSLSSGTIYEDDWDALRRYVFLALAKSNTLKKGFVRNIPRECAVEVGKWINVLKATIEFKLGNADPDAEEVQCNSLFHNVKTIDYEIEPLGLNDENDDGVVILNIFCERKMV